jgi:HAD superfamily hydrolase (TIGR01549 family)
LSKVRAVVFDVGETLIDETRHWGEWADWFGIPRFTFFAVLGGVIARGEHHARAFQIFRPGFDLVAARQQRIVEGWRYEFLECDFYPDVAPCIDALTRQGIRIGIAGNQPAEAERTLTKLGLPLDVVLSSASLGFEKPDQRFFAAVIAAFAPLSAGEIAYVGDRLDNDIVPARQAGMRAICLHRGPWAYLNGSDQASDAEIRIDTLRDLPASLDKLK